MSASNRWLTFQEGIVEKNENKVFPESLRFFTTYYSFFLKRSTLAANDFPGDQDSAPDRGPIPRHPIQ